MLLRALGAQPRRRKPAFVTHDNEASLCVSEQWLESKPIKKKVESDSESDNEDEPPTSGKNKYKK